MTQKLPLNVRFLKRFSRRLHQAGVPAHQLEGMVTAIARWMGYRCDIWSSPTAIFLALQHIDEADADSEETSHIPMQLIRLQPGSINLADTTELYRMGESLISGRLGLDLAYQQLQQPRKDFLYPGWLKIVCGGAVSAAFVVLLAGSVAGMIIAALAGILLGLLYAYAGKAAQAGGMEAIAAVLITLLVYAANSSIGGIDPATIIMSGLIVLMPGLSLTIAVTELSTDHLASGSARLAGALIVLLKLALGVLIGTVIAKWLGWDQQGQWVVLAQSLPAWAEWLALLLAAVSFALLFNVRLKDFPIAVLAALAGYGVSRAGVILGGVEFGVMLAALVIALLGNLLGRVLRRPAALVRVPGIILLVPGALGYRAVSNVLMQGNPNSQETALLVATLVIALVGGLLIGNTIVPPRRYL